MKQLNNWNNINPSYEGESVSVPADGYVCVIKDVRDSGKGYLELLLDIAKGQFEGIYQARFKATNKWGCKSFVFYESTNPQYQENTASKFKGFITSIEESNKGFKWAWDETKLKGLYVGCVFGEEEFITQEGEIKVAVKPRWFRSVKKIMDGDFKIPKRKEVDSPAKQIQQTSKQWDNDTVDIASDDLPF